MLGLVALATVVSSYCYYLFWVIILPFIPEDHGIQTYFPDSKYAFILPAFVILAIITSVMTYLGYVLINSEKYSKPLPKPWELK
jgi:dolichyl-phosphate mannosyltransferase polypeptide 2 regulatory subunit